MRENRILIREMWKINRVYIYRVLQIFGVVY
jgi:hypothetical protein